MSYEKTTLSLSTMEKRDSEVSTKILTNLIISDLDENIETEIPILYTKNNKSCNFSKQDLPTTADVEYCLHLTEVPFQFIDAEIYVLSGMDMPGLMKTLKIVEGECD
jgi:hypothetical protein